MLKLRLQRRGKKNYATYRVVVADQHAPIKGKFLSDIGFYNPHTNIFTVQSEQVDAWMKKGAQPSATVHNLLITHGIIKGEKVKSWRAKKKPQAAGTATPTPAAPAEKPAEEVAK